MARSSALSSGCRKSLGLVSVVLKSGSSTLEPAARRGLKLLVGVKGGADGQQAWRVIQQR
ncbi:hypothetical protein PF003_g29542 [Phytophthora fragariae]|nr:hypothetical protein PF003_g29542 [Phytophthora fragariae]